ncbi:MAG TPA: TVP38/TMEM64 family protein [Gemmataceae bacterium]|nr:TVP38/TMEM64 family protein [Gemmataceae bacterium]
MKSWSRWILVVGLVLAIVLFYALGLQDYFGWDHVNANLDDWQTAAREHLAVALVVYFLIYVAVTALSLPVAGIVTAVAGALFGRWLGTGVVSVASTLGAVLAFLSSRYIFRDWVERRFGSRLEALNRGVERDGAYYLLTLRLVPLFPFFLINLGMGLTRMRVATYAVVSMIGMLPGTFLYVYAGEALASVASPKDLLSANVLIALALLGVVPLVIRKIVAKT